MQNDFTQVGTNTEGKHLIGEVITDKARYAKRGRIWVGVQGRALECDTIRHAIERLSLGYEDKNTWICEIVERAANALKARYAVTNPEVNVVHEDIVALCLRLEAKGYKIGHIDADLTALNRKQFLTLCSIARRHGATLVYIGSSRAQISPDWLDYARSQGIGKRFPTEIQKGRLVCRRDKARGIPLKLLFTTLVNSIRGVESRYVQGYKGRCPMVAGVLNFKAA